MISLGHLSVANTDQVIELRKKIRWLSQSLGFAENHSARLEAIASEVGRLGCRNDQQLDVLIALTDGEPYALCLEFHSRNRLESIAGIAYFFDEYRFEATAAGMTCLSAVKYLPLDAACPSAALIEAQREVLGQLSRNELLSMLQGKTEELEHRAVELNKLSLAVTNSPVSVVITDQHGRIEYVNPKFVENTGYRAEEAIGKTPRVLKSGFHGREFYQEMWNTIASGHLWQGELCNQRKDGSQFWEATSISPIHGADGQISHFVAIKEDVTERKEMTEALRSKIEEMDKSRKAMLNILEDLDEAKQKADEATKTKSDFLANMSHEIRTPMNAIIGMSHLALQTELDKKQRNYIDKVHRAGVNLLGIINDILDFSKIEAGKMSMEAADFRLEEVMDHLANLVGLKTAEKGLELLFKQAPDVPTALIGDSLRLGQVLINLGNNAVKFTEHGEIVVGIEKIAEDEHEVELHFWVEDTGIGMTPEQCGKMFQSFSQADASTTRKYGGTGLGLAISKNLVELMHGRIWVESEAGKGSTFHFHAKFGLQADPMPRRVFRADELLGVRTLVVDDNASSREILLNLAKTYGLEVDTAWDGQQALNKISAAEKKEQPYELVLLDWKMPVMDGFETLQRLQEEAPSRPPAVIMVTAFTREETLSAAEQCGLALKTVLTKPVTASTLLEAIGEVLGKGFVAETQSSEKANTYDEAMTKLKGARVVLTEDNEMNQELAMELLSQAGVDVVLANNGQEALDILARDANFDGVLMDCQMPVMDGYTATREIRKNPAFARLPIIAMTANAMAGDKEKVMEAGMNDHIAKPLNVGEMFNTLAHWIKPAAYARNDKATVAATVAKQVVGTETTSPPAPVAALQQGALPSLPGIDMKAGMATTMNNEKLYTRMLIKFRDSQCHFAELFATALTDADPVAPARTAHTLKGTAGNIGAKGIQAAAAELEHACNAQADPEQIEQLLQKTLAELAPVIAGLQSITPEGTAPGRAAIGWSESERQEKLAKLKSMLEDSDSTASELLDQIIESSQGTPLAAALKQAAELVANYDFDEALEVLAPLTQ